MPRRYCVKRSIAFFQHILWVVSVDIMIVEKGVESVQNLV